MKKTLLFCFLLAGLLQACNKDNAFMEQAKAVGSGSAFHNHLLHDIPLHTMLPGTRKNYEALILAREVLHLRPWGADDTIGYTSAYKLMSFTNFQFRLNNSPWSDYRSPIQLYHGIVPGKANYLQTRWEKGTTSNVVFIPKVLEVEASQDLMNKPYKKSPFHKLHFTWEPDPQNTAEQLIISIEIRKDIFFGPSLHFSTFLIPDNGVFELDSLLTPYQNCFVSLNFRRFHLKLLDNRSGLILETDSHKNFTFFISE